MPRWNQKQILRKLGMRAPKLRRRLPPGASPGDYKNATLEKTGALSFKLVSYNQEAFEESLFAEVDKAIGRLRPNCINWLHITGSVTLEVISRLADQFQLNRLALEDVIEKQQRSKFEPYDDQIFITIMLVSQVDGLKFSQLNMFLKENFIITFHDTQDACLEPVLERLRQPVGRLRRLGSAYLVYAMLDAIIDTYFPVLETISNGLDEVEKSMIQKGFSTIPVESIHFMKSELFYLQRINFSNREMINDLSKDAFFSEVLVYLQDCRDHTEQQVDLVESYLFLGSSLMDLSFNLSNAEANGVMKILTLVTSVFIPLSFIASIYGMNFNTALPGNMPELNTPYGYVTALLGMGTIALGLILLFKFKKWI